MPERFIPCYGSLCLRPYQPDLRIEGSLTGDIRHHTLESRYVGSRDFLVYLPPGFSQQDSWRYPLALLHDGQNIFDAKTAVFGVEWGVDEAAERLIVEQRLRPLIMVAIYNSENRIAEYTPFPDQQHGGGEAQNYRRFLVEELLPFLEGTYPLTNSREERAVIGSSLGGLLSLYLGWTQSEHFGMVGALSPSLWWGGRGLITGLAGTAAPKFRPRIWLDAGTHESGADSNGNGVPDLLDDLRTLRAVLVYQGYQEGLDLHYHEWEGQTHDEQSWSSRVGDVLECFFPKSDPSQTHLHW